MARAATELPPLIELLASARVVALPLRTTFRGITEREALLFEGPNGWAEWSPFVEYPDEEAAVWLAAAIEFAYGDLPVLNRNRIPVNATLPAVPVDQVASILARFGRFSTVKIKVGGPTADSDFERIRAVAQGFPEVRIRLDANGAFTVEQALAVAHFMVSNGFKLDYLEQPVATIAELAELRLRLSRDGIGHEVAGGVRVAADESVRRVSDPLAVVLAGAADLLVLKAAPLGGISRSLEIARQSGLPVIISSALDTSVGLSMGAHLAAALPGRGVDAELESESESQLEFDCGLGTAALLAGDVTRNPLLPIDGFIDVRRVEVDPDKLDLFEAEDHRIDWWIERLDRCFKLL